MSRMSDVVSARSASSSGHSNSRAGHSSASSGTQDDVLYQLHERVDLAAAERLLASAGMRQLRVKSEAYWQSICNTVSVARALGGYVPVDYTRPSGCPDFYGRMRASVAVDGLPSVPYVRMVRGARAALAAPFYVDVDMVNCQPRLLAQKLALHEIACPHLDRYIAAREASITEVDVSCGGCGRDAAKNLFIRLMYFGGTAAWASEYGVDEARLPAWVGQLRDEMKSNAALLLAHTDLQEFKVAVSRQSASRPPADSGVGCMDASDASDASHDCGSASLMALYLQSVECECVRALVDAIRADGCVVGSIIYDGVLVERDSATAVAVQFSDAQLRRWAAAVHRKTGMSIELAAKRLDASDASGRAEWDADASASPDASDAWEDAWMKGFALLSYEDMKKQWERRSFKIVKSGNYVREECDVRDVFSDRMLHDSYKHLHYAVFKTKGDREGTAGCPQPESVHASAGRACQARRVEVTRQPFIARWTKDPRIKSFKDMVLMPPPMVVPPDMYNIWNGFAVERYDPKGREVNTASEAVLAYLDLLFTLFSRNEADYKYFLDWVAQIFQHPSVKTGIAVLLVGCEGAGKNRATDLLRLMMGPKDRFLQTASPANTLFGRFNRVREGRLLIVINESSGGDNFAANDLIKDMITCDEFVSEGKGTNSYAIACFARFVFTTNNDNCLKVSPDSRRFFVKEVSSALKGNFEYFKRLSAFIDDEHGRYEFYRMLMERDISNIDWINNRPVTDYMLTMIDLNLPLEHQFVKDMVLRAFHSPAVQPVHAAGSDAAAAGQPSRRVKVVQMEALFNKFMDWATQRLGAASPSLAGMNDKKFGLRMSKLVWTADANTTGFSGIVKERKGAGMVYQFDIDKLAQEMVEKRWAAPDDFVRVRAQTPMPS